MPASQAGRRGFDPRLPLKSFPNPVLIKPAMQVLYQNEDPRFGKHSPRSCAESGVGVAGSEPEAHQPAMRSGGYALGADPHLQLRKWS
jgi:hypothetical protein